MPQTTDTERAWATEKFGSIDCGPVIRWLEQQGYKLRQDWCWEQPARQTTEEERRAICFLIDEWDFGGVV